MQDRSREDADRMRAELDQKRKDALDGQQRMPGAINGFVPIVTPNPVTERAAAPQLPPQQQIINKETILNKPATPAKPTDLAKQKGDRGDKGQSLKPEFKNAEDLKPQKGGLDRGKKGKDLASRLNSALGRANAPHVEDQNEEEEDDEELMNGLESETDSGSDTQSETES